MDEPKHHSEIVLRITPRNLERMIYILIIIGLSIFSVVEIMKNPDCPVCDEIIEEIIVEEVPEEEETEEVVEEVTEEEEDPDLSGDIEFILQSAKTCVIDESLDQGRIDKVGLYIKNGLDRTVKLQADLYVYNEGQSFNQINDFATKVEDITLLSGATISREFVLTTGRFLDLDTEKKVKVILRDSETAVVHGDQTVKDVATTVDC